MRLDLRVFVKGMGIRQRENWDFYKLEDEWADALMDGLMNDGDITEVNVHEDSD